MRKKCNNYSTCDTFLTKQTHYTKVSPADTTPMCIIK